MRCKTGTLAVASVLSFLLVGSAFSLSQVCGTQWQNLLDADEAFEEAEEFLNVACPGEFCEVASFTYDAAVDDVEAAEDALEECKAINAVP